VNFNICHCSHRGGDILFLDWSPQLAWHPSHIDTLFHYTNLFYRRVSKWGPSASKHASQCENMLLDIHHNCCLGIVEIFMPNIFFQIFWIVVLSVCPTNKSHKGHLILQDKLHKSGLYDMLGWYLELQNYGNFLLLVLRHSCNWSWAFQTLLHVQGPHCCKLYCEIQRL
jgi:hypothetical protein